MRLHRVCRERAISHKVDVELLWRLTSPFDPLLYRKPLTMDELSATVVAAEPASESVERVSRKESRCAPLRRLVDLRREISRDD